MNKFVLTIIVMCLSVMAGAQSYNLMWNGELFMDGDTIYITPDSVTATEIVLSAELINNTENGVNIELVRNELQLVDGSVNYFCWDSCYLPDVDSSLLSVYIPAGSSSPEGAFAGHYEINETTGSSLIEYKFYKTNHPDDKFSIFVRYDKQPAGINENLLSSINVSKIYPNPTSNYIHQDYNLPPEVKSASVRIINIMGITVMDEQITRTDNKVSFNISVLPRGMYLYSLIINNELLNTYKLIVQ